jgi:repressor of nif and glnA expression
MAQVRNVTDEEILRCFGEAGEPLTARDVAEALETDITSRGVLERLHGLKEEGELNNKRPGANAIVWWRPGDFRPESVPQTRRR